MKDRDQKLDDLLQWLQLRAYDEFIQLDEQKRIFGWIEALESAISGLERP